MLPTVGFPVAQFNPIQQPLMAVGIVPIAFVHDLNLNKWFVRDELRSLGTTHQPRYIVTIKVTGYLALLFTAAMQESSVNLPT